MTGSVFTLELPGRPPTANKIRGKHSHWSQSAHLTKQWRTAARAATQAAITAHKAPAQAGTIHVTARQLSKDRRWLQDLGACFPTVKACIDGLVDAGLVPDDTHEYVTSLTFLPPDVCGYDALRLDVYTTPHRKAA